MDNKKIDETTDEKKESSGVEEMNLKEGSKTKDEEKREKEKKEEKKEEIFDKKRNKKKPSNTSKKYSKTNIIDSKTEAKADSSNKVEDVVEKTSDGVSKSENFANFMAQKEGYEYSPNNESSYTNDYSFSLKHFIRSKLVDDKKYIYDGTYFTARTQTYIHFVPNDIYQGASFKHKTDFWTARINLIIHFVILQIQLKFRCDVVINDQYLSEVSTLADSEIVNRIDYSKIKPFVKDSLIYTRWMHANMVRFYSNNLIQSLAPIQLGGGAVLKSRRATVQVDQGLYSPVVPSYLRRCITNSIGLYNELSSKNPATNLFILKFNSENIKNDSQLVLRHPEQLDNTRINEYISTLVPSYRSYILRRIKSLLSDFIDLQPGHITTNVSQISTTLNVIITNVSAANSIANSVFSTNVTDIFLTLVSGSCMSNMFKFTYDLNLSGGFNLTSVLSCCSYLVYVTNALMDPQTVVHIKSYLWLHLLGLYKYALQNGNEVNSLIYDPVNPTQNGQDQAFDRNDAVVGQKLNYAYQSWVQYIAVGANTNPIFSFFNYEFPQTAPTNGFNSLYEGPTGMTRFTLIINLLLAVNAFGIANGTISTATKNTIMGFIDVLRNQAVAYEQMTVYMNTCTDYLMSLDLANFGPGPYKYDLPIEPNKLLSMTCKLDSFSADFKISFHNIHAWSLAVKFEIGTCVTLFRKLWSDTNYWNVYLDSNHRIRKFMDPFMESFGYLMTTDVGKWVYANLWMNMTRETVVVDPLFDVWDQLELSDLFDTINNEIIALETRCGYCDEIAYNSAPLFRGGNDLEYLLTSGHPATTPRFTRHDAFINPDLPSCTIHTSDKDFPCFRIKPTERSQNNTAGSDESLFDSIRSSQGVVDIPLYYRLVETSSLRLDPIYKLPPLVIPLNSIPLVTCDRPFLTPGDGNPTVTYFHNEVTDILCSSSDELKNIFTIITI